MFVVSLAMDSPSERIFGLPMTCSGLCRGVRVIGFMLPALLGVPMFPGWITRRSRSACCFWRLRAGPEASALFALQFLVFVIFLITRITRLRQHDCCG